MLSTTIFLFLLFFFMIYKYLTRNSDFFTKNNIPAKPFSFKNFRVTKNFAITLDDVYKKFKGNNFAGLFQITTPTLLALDPEWIKKIYISNFNNFHDNLEFFDIEDTPIMKSNPFVLKGNEWKMKRNEISPAFTTTRIKAMHSLMDEVCGNMTTYIKKETAKDPEGGIDTKELFAKFATDVVANCIFAVDAASFTQEKPIIREMGKVIFRSNPVIFFYFFVIQTFPMLKKIIPLRLVPKNVEEFFLKVMQDAINYRRDNNIDRQDYLQYLISLKEKKEITDEDMSSHGVTFFFNGFDTSSQLIATTLYELALNKDVQTKLRQEIKDSSDENGKINFDTLYKMKYLDQTINESLRILPPLAASTKQCTEDFEIEITKDHKFLVKKGMQVQLPIYSIHRDPEFYDEPLKFKPERFNEEFGGVKAYQDKGVFLPFGMGPRICVGKKFAVIQAKTAIVETIRNFEVSVNPKMIEPFDLDVFNFLLTPKGGYWLNYIEVK